MTKKPAELAHEDGYNDGWLGVGKINTYPINTDEYFAYERGYHEGDSDAVELESANYRNYRSEIEGWDV